MRTAAFALLALMLPAAVGAQPRWDHDDRRPRRASVTFYEHPDFRGDSFTVLPGESISNLDGKRFERGARINDRISSIRVEGDVEVMVYRDSRYRGDVMRVTRDLRDLSDIRVGNRNLTWNDYISSLRVEYDRSPDPRPDHARPGNRPSPAVDIEKIINRAYQDVLQRNVDDTGLRTFRSRMIEQGWTEQMVRDALRKSEEYRTVTVVNIVRRAYAELLGRETDGGGERHYVYQLLNRGWSEEDVRNDLRKSAEYRNRQLQNPAPPAPKQADRDHDRGTEREAK